MEWKDALWTRFSILRPQVLRRSSDQFSLTRSGLWPNDIALDQVTILFFHGVDQFSERIAAREAPPDARALGRDRRRSFSHSVPGGSERGAIPACWLGSIRHCPSGPRHNVAEAFTCCPPILMVCVTF